MPGSNVKKLRLTLIPLALLLASGCAAMGKTSLQATPLEGSELPEIIAPIQVKSVSKEAGAAQEYPVGVGPGNYGFSDEDLANLKGSLESSIESAMDSKTLDSTKQVRILLKVRSYVVAYTNHSLAMLAEFDWCAVRKDGSAIEREVFYAPRSWNILGPTPGQEKDAITRSVVRRVGGRSLMFAAGSGLEEARSKPVDGTYDTFEEAVATLPQNMQSWGLVYFSGPVPIFVGGSDISNIPWQSVDTTAAISCDAMARNKQSS